MDFNLRQLRAFAAIARTGSFTRAAAELHLSQPALTVQVRTLEEALGSRLLDRTTRGVRLTEAGRELLPVFERVLGDLRAVAESARSLASGDRGVVRVAALPSVCSHLLPRTMARLRASHPGIAVRLRDTVAQRIVSLLHAEEADLGIGSFQPAERGLEVAPLAEDGMVAVLPPRHALRARRRVRLAELAACPLVFMDTQSSVRRLVDQAFAGAGIAVVPAHEVTYMSTAAGLVKAGLGVAILPATAFELESVPGLATRPIADASLRRRIGIARKAGRSVSPAAAAFLAALRLEAARRPA